MTTTTPTATMTVEDAVGALRDARDDARVVLTMSAIAYWTDVRDDDYRLMGLMGGAASIGLGVAIGRPERPVWVLDGDGSLLMQLGVLSAVADAAPSGFVHVVVDNAMYAISGGQPTPGPADWPGLFRSAGYGDSRLATTPDEIRAALAEPCDGPLGLVVRCVPERPDYPAGVFAVSPADEAARVRAALGPPADS